MSNGKNIFYQRKNIVSNPVNRTNQLDNRKDPHDFEIHPRTSSDGPIAVLESVFARQPALLRVAPVTYERQTTARKVIRKGDRDHHVGLYASRLNQAMVPFESSLEKQACALFESYPEIQKYRTQPYAVRLYYAGKFRTVYPDFELTTINQNVLVDIRYESKTRQPLFRKRCEALQFYAEQRGMAYTLLTEKTIRGQRLLNSQWLLSLAHGAPNPTLIQSVLEWIHELDNPTFDDLFEQIASYPQIRCVLACLVLDGHLAIDLQLPLWKQQIALRTVAEV